MFTPQVLRDAYRFLTNPGEPGVPVADSLHQFGAALLGKKSSAASSDPFTAFAFVDRAAAASLPSDWQLLEDSALLSAIDHLGKLEPLPMAATQAFEKYLARKAANWQDIHVRRLSIEFAVAFGRELTPRLDVHHLVRSTKLSDQEIRVLSSAPFSTGVDQSVLRLYQEPQVQLRPPSTLISSAPQSAPQPSSPSQPSLPALPPPSTFHPSAGLWEGPES